MKSSRTRGNAPECARLGGASRGRPTRTKAPVLLLLLAGVLLCLLLSTQVALARTWTTLEPGGATTISQDLAINVVMIGFTPGSGAAEIDEARLLSALPADFQPYGESLEFAYHYNTVWADAAFQDRFFGYLGSIAVDKPLTSWQEAYNAQVHASQDVTSNCSINAPSVERWLGDNLARLSVDRRQYTVVLVNWYGRPDFRFHVYDKTNEPDPDTDVNFGADQDRTRVIAWGGTAPDDPQDPSPTVKRVWFCDLSAGPDGYTGSWNVDDQRVASPLVPGPPPAQGAMSYRVPPVWEYGNMSGYRPFDDLTADAAKLVGDVAVRGLFTSNGVGQGDGGSVALSQTRIPRSIQMALTLFDLDPASKGADWVRPAYVVKRLQRLEPWRRFSVSTQRLSPPDPAATEAHAAYQSWMYWWYSGMTDLSQTIYPGAPDNDTPLGDLLIYVRRHLPLLVDSGSSAFQIPALAFSLPDADASWTFGMSMADPSTSLPITWVFTTPIERSAAGYGLTTSLVHEFGHNVGLDHPHDDIENRRMPRGATYYMWTGSEVNSMMSYIDLNWDFSQFDYDNAARSMTAVYVNQSNGVLGRIILSGHGGFVRGLLREADRHATQSLKSYQSMRYRAAALQAQGAYEDLLTALRRIRAKFGPAAVLALQSREGRPESPLVTVPRGQASMVGD